MILIQQSCRASGSPPPPPPPPPNIIIIIINLDPPLLLSFILTCCVYCRLVICCCFFIFTKTVQSCGVLYNYDENLLLLNGFVKCYDQPYSTPTTSSDLNTCNGSQFVFVGAKNSSLTTNFTIGAFGSSNIFAVTTSTSTAYWYRYPSYSFGFASSSSVTLNVCDEGSTDCVSHLCWHLDVNVGGW